MAEPVSATAASAVAATAVATGGSAGAVSGCAATGTAVGGTTAAGAGTAGAGGAGSAAAGGAAATGTAATGAGVTGAGTVSATTPAAGSTSTASVPLASSGGAGALQWSESVAPAETPATVPTPSGFTGERIDMPGMRFEWTKESPKSGAGSSAGRAVSEETMRQPAPTAKQPQEPPAKRDPAAPVQSRPEAPKPQTARPGQQGPEPPRLAEPGQESPSADQRAKDESRPMDRIFPRKPGETFDPNDPHEKEREALNKLLEHFEELPERKKRETESRLIVFDFREKERNKDETLVTGPLGTMEAWRYEEVAKNREEAEKFRQQLEVGRAIAQGNPLSSSVGLYVIDKTGDLEAGINTMDAISGLTGGGGRNTPRTVRNPTPRGMRAPTRTRPSGAGRRTKGGKGAPKEKVPAGKTSPPPPKKLSARQKHYQKEVQRLKDSIPDKIKRDKVTIAILIVEKQGKREVWITSSLENVPREVREAASKNHYIVPGSNSPKGNKDLPKDRQVSFHHAEHDGIHVAASNGYKVIEVYPSRPACSDCAGFRDMGYIIIDPP